MKRLILVGGAILLLIIGITALPRKLSGKPDHYTASSLNLLLNSANANGLLAERVKYNFEDCCLIQINDVSQISLIPKSDAPIIIHFRECSLQLADVESLLDGRTIRFADFEKCVLASSALVKLSMKPGVSEFSFDTCSLAPTPSPHASRLGEILTVGNCNQDFIDFVTPCIGESYRVFLIGSNDVTLELGQLEQTAHLSMTGISVTTNDSFRQSTKLNILSFTDCVLDSVSFSRCLVLKNLVLLGVESCEIIDLERITVPPGFTHRYELDVADEALRDQLRRIGVKLP